MQEGYNNIQKAYRKKFLELLAELEKNYDNNITQKLKDRISRIATDYSNVDGTISRKSIKAINQELDQLSSWLSSEVNDLLDDNITKSIELSIEGQDQATRWYLNKLVEENDSLRDVVNNALNGTSKTESILLSVRYGQGLIKEIRDQVWNNRWDDGKKLSNRVWDFKNNSYDMMKQTIEQNINQGKSAVNFAKELQDKFEGTTRYQAMRLARTETNQAYHRGQKMSDKESIIVKGTKWNLSSSHPTYPPSYEYNGYNEICNYRAEANHHNMGAGVYPAGETPFDHPNGLCYLTSVLYQKEELINKLKGKYGD